MEIEILALLHASPVSAISTAQGPQRLLEAGLAARLGALGHGVNVKEVPSHAGDVSGAVGREFALAAVTAERVRAARAARRLPIVLSGSCHAALGCVAGLDVDRRGIVWLDAHADFNTPETTESGLLDGMVLATITGRCWTGLAARIPGFEPVADADVLMLGVRALDRGESGLLEESAITVLPVARFPGGLEAALNALAGRVEGVYVHLDLDVLDASEGRANAYALEGGLTANQLGTVLAAIQRICGIGVLTVASYDPAADPDGTACAAAVGAIATAFA